MTKIVETSHRVRKEQLRSSFSTSLRTVSELSVLEFHIKTDDGVEVFGETVETPAITGDTIARIQSDFDLALSRALIGKEFEDATSFYSSHIAQISATSSAKSAVNLALYELQGVMSGQSLQEILGCPVDCIKSDVTIPLSQIADIPKLIAARSDFSTFKIKLGNEDMKTRVEKIQLIRDIAGIGVGIRIDPNQAWSVDESLDFLLEIEKRGLNIEYLEQPITAKNKAGLAQIRQNSDTKIMADESIYTVADLDELHQLKAVDLINIKTIKSGGITPALQIIERANELGIGFSIGTMMEGDKGVLAAVLIAGAHRPDYCHDLDAAWWAANTRFLYAKSMVRI